MSIQRPSTALEGQTAEHAAGSKPGSSLAEPVPAPAPERATKPCFHCGVEKPLEDFSHHSDGRYSSWCKQCGCARQARIRATPLGRARDILANHKKRGQNSFASTVAPEWVAKRLAQGCPVFGVPFRQSGTGQGPDCPTLDHFVPGDSSADNAWLISHRANSIKHDGTPEEIVKVGVFTHIVRNFSHTLTQTQFTSLRDSLNAEVSALIEQRINEFKKNIVS